MKRVANKEDAPFGHYWGRLAIGRAVDLARRQGGVPPGVIDDLRQLLPEFDTGTDRHYELRRMLDKVQAGSE